MSDYISLETLEEHKFQESELRGMGEGQAYRQGWNDAIDAIIDNEPAADVVEVVRCKDCIYRPCKMMPYSYDHDFCSYGERQDA